MSAKAGTILLVEDDPNDVLLMQRAFQKGKLANRMDVVENGEEAVAYLGATGSHSPRSEDPPPMLVLLDLKLPRKSGLEVLEWLRTQPVLKRVPVVVLTSSRQTSDINRAYDLGANSYLVKPVAFEDLLKLVVTLNMYWAILNQPPTPDQPV